MVLNITGLSQLGDRSKKPRGKCSFMIEFYEILVRVLAVYTRQPCYQGWGLSLNLLGFLFLQYLGGKAEVAGCLCATLLPVSIK